MVAPNFKTAAEGGNGFPMIGGSGLPKICGPVEECCGCDIGNITEVEITILPGDMLSVDPSGDCSHGDCNLLNGTYIIPADFIGGGASIFFTHEFNPGFSWCDSTVTTQLTVTLTCNSVTGTITAFVEIDSSPPTLGSIRLWERKEQAMPMAGTMPVRNFGNTFPDCRAGDEIEYIFR
jgi:hypothetical protein